MPEFSLLRDDGDGGTEFTLVLSGELDYLAAPLIRDALIGVLQANPTSVVVDLAAVPFVDSSGLGVLVSGWKRAVAQGSRLRLRHVDQKVRRVLALTALDTVLEVEPDGEPDARSELSAG